MALSPTDLKNYIRSIPDWPKPGIIFRDITPLLEDAKALTASIDALCNGFLGLGIQYVAAVEARGFVFGPAIADRLGAGFIPIRKKGKLPYETVSVTYELEYGTDTLEIHKDAVKSGARILMVDDLLATGGTMTAGCQLIEKAGGDIVGISCLIELKHLKGREKIARYNFKSVMTY